MLPGASEGVLTWPNFIRTSRIGRPPNSFSLLSRKHTQHQRIISRICHNRSSLHPPYPLLCGRPLMSWDHCPSRPAMGFSLGTSTPRHHPLLQSNSPPRAPTVRRNASKRPPTIAALHHQDGVGGKEGPIVCRRSILMVALAGSSLLRLGEAVLAEDPGAGSEDAYEVVTFDRRRLQKKGRSEYEGAGAGRIATGAQTSQVQRRDGGAVEAHGNDARKGGAAPNIMDGKASTEIKGKDFEKINQEVPSSRQNVTVVKKEVPSLTQNETQGVRQEEVSTNSSFSIMNSVGILGSGVLGALYAISQKDKAAMQSTVDSMKSLNEEKEAAKRSLEKSFLEKMLTEQEKHRKEVKTLQQGEAAVAKQLASANATVSALGKELRSEKNTVEELSLQLDQFRASLVQAGDEKRELEGKLKEKMDEVGALQDRVSLLGFNIKERDKDIEELNISLAKKRSECEKLNSVLDAKKADYESLSSSLEKLKEEVAQTEKEITVKNSKINELNSELKSVLAKREKPNKDIAILQKEYSNLKMAWSMMAEVDSKLLSKKDDQLQNLKEKLDLALKEMQNKEVLVTTLTKEKDNFEAALKEESENAETLRGKILKLQVSLKTSKLVTSELSKQLKESRHECEALNSEISRVQNEHSKQKKSLTSSLNEAQAVSDNLSNELATAKQDLNTATQELLKVTNELKASSDACESLESKALEANKEAKASSHELQKEREVVTNLHKELEGSRKQIVELLEARKTLESSLGKASASLDEINNKALLLSKELENAKSKNARLEKERETLQASLAEQRNAAKDALEKIEDAQNTIFRLGAERESLVKKNEKFKEELESAKGEILWLRQQPNPRGTSLRGDHNAANKVEASATPETAKRTAGRRKRGNHISE